MFFLSARLFSQYGWKLNLTTIAIIAASAQITRAVNTKAIQEGHPTQRGRAREARNSIMPNVIATRHTMLASVVKSGTIVLVISVSALATWAELAPVATTTALITMSAARMDSVNSK